MAITNKKIVAARIGNWGKGMIKGILTVLLGCVYSVSSFAAVNMQNIEFSSLPGDKIEVRMQFDGVPPTPTGYTIEQPARIALDLMGVKSGLKSKYHPLGSGNARSVTVVEAGDRTRVIVSMTELVPYSTQVVGNSLLVLVGQEDSAVAISSESSDFSAQIEAPTSIRCDRFCDSRIDR